MSDSPAMVAKNSLPKNIGETLPFPFRIMQLAGLIELEGSPRAPSRLKENIGRGVGSRIEIVLSAQSLCEH